MIARIALVDSHPTIPLVGDTCEVRINSRSQSADEVGKRVSEITILALAEAVPRHVDLASEMILLGIEGRDSAALLGREKFWQDGATVTVQFARESLPVINGNTCLCGV